MKKLLIGTTALVAAGSLATGAQAADKIKMGVGGYFLAFLVGGSQDDGAGQPGANRRGFDVKREAEIIFSGSTKLDNGITVGAQVQLEAETCGDQIDESFIFFSGGFGRIIIGSENSAAYLMHYASPAPSHWAHGLNSPGFRHVSGGGNTANFQSSRQQMSGDSEKITYFSPRFGGFQVGVSYTPDNTEANSTNGRGSYSGLAPDNNANQQSEVIEIGANFVKKFGAVSLRVSGGYGKGENEAPTGAGADDRTEWSVGGSVSFAGLTIGAGYRLDDNGNSANNNDEHHFNAGVRFARGAWGVGVQYAYVSQEAGQGSGGTEDEYNGIEIGGSYTLGPGVNVNAGIQFHELDDNTAGTANDNDAVIFFIGTALSL